jgi:superfamily II DNA/RNA helicase
MTFLEPKTFAELGLSDKVQQAITAAGYVYPTPIQAEAIPIAMSGRDVLGIAQTGTGKTASFTLPMISRLETGRARARMPRSLILAPTRELAAQVAQSFEKYGVNHKLDLALLIGGVSMDEQTKKLDRGVDVLIATPGRLLDHLQRGRIMLMGVEILVIDEADRMLDMGFIPDIEKICKMLPPRRQSLFFSATMPPEITRLVHQFQRDPVRVEVAPPATTAKTITQKFCYCPDGEDWAKRDALRGLIREAGVRNAIIFCNRKVEVAILLKSLLKHGFNAGALHGDMDQKSRTETLDKFRAGEIAFLAASDVAARGLDIPDVSHVFNFDLPRDKDDYVHRIGRTGRAGKEGHSTSLVTPFDLKQLADIEKIIGEPAVWTGAVPSAQDYADAGKRKRPRPGAPATGRGGKPVGSRERPMPQRGAQQPNGERRGGPRRPGPSDRDEAPQRKELLNTGQRRSIQDEDHRSAPNDALVAVLTADTSRAAVRRSEPVNPEPVRARPAPERVPRGHEPQPDLDGGRDPASPRSGGGDRERGPRRVRPQRSDDRGARQAQGERPSPTRSEGRSEPRTEPRGEPRGQPQRNSGPGREGSFADNVPAFLQRPVRPVRPGSDS